MNRTWKDYVNEASEEDKTNLLHILLNYMLSWPRDADIAYTNGTNNEYEDERIMPECFYWTSCGEPLKWKNPKNE